MDGDLDGWKPDWYEYVTLKYVLSKEHGLPARCAWTASSLLLMGLLTFSTAGVMQGIDEASCDLQAECEMGHWCNTQVGHCTQCKEEHISWCPAEPGEAVHPEVRFRQLLRGPRRKRRFQQAEELETESTQKVPPTFPLGRKDFNAMCDGCFSEEQGRQVTRFEAARMKVASMRMCDWATVLVCVMVVVLYILEELRDNLLLEVALEASGADLGFGWHCAVWFLCSMRHFAFLPCIVYCVPTLITTSGGNALKVCLDTVAVLFVLELDNIMVRLALSAPELPSLQQRLGAALAKPGRATTSLWSDRLHVLLISAAVYFQLLSALWVTDMPTHGCVLVAIPSAFLASALLEVPLSRPPGSRGRALASVLGQWTVGLVWLLVNISAAGEPTDGMLWWKLLFHHYGPRSDAR